MFTVYILFSPEHNRYYVGQTDNLERRLKRHQAGEVFSTKPYGPWQLKYTENFSTRAEAMRREKEIKNRKSRKYIEKRIAGQK